MKVLKYWKETFQTRAHPQELTPVEWEKEERDVTKHTIEDSYCVITWAKSKRHTDIKFKWVKQEEYFSLRDKHDYFQDNTRPQ